MYQLIITIWPLLALVGLVILVRVFFEVIIPRLFSKFRLRSAVKWNSEQDLINKLRYLKPSEFEDYTANLFEKLGYKTIATGNPNDGGIDVVAEKDGVKHYIQCKKYFNARQVSVGEVRDFYGAIAGKVTNGKGYFITTNKFTLEAEKFAEDKPIELIDRFKLAEYVRLAEKNKTAV